MEEQYIDIANFKRQYENALRRLDDCDSVSAANKDLVRRFVRDAALGKTIVGRKKRKVGSATLVGYLNHLMTFMLRVKKDLDQLSITDMEHYIEALETDAVASRARRVIGSSVAACGKPYSPRYKVDNKVVIRKFYKWLWGENKRYPEIVEWFDTYCDEPEIPALSEAEIEKLLDKSRSTFERAFVQTLFDGGYRLGELLNVRLKHVQFIRFDDGTRSIGTSLNCFSLRVPYSKTLPRTVLMPIPTTTKWLKLWLEEHPANPRINDDGTIDANDLMAPLFPISDGGARHRINRLGKRALNKRVYPHLIRHTSATYWANRLSYFQLCKRFGWTMTSQQPQRYIDRSGMEQLPIVEKFHEDDRAKLVREKALLQAELAELRDQLSDSRRTTS